MRLGQLTTFEYVQEDIVGIEFVHFDCVLDGLGVGRFG